MRGFDFNNSSILVLGDVILDLKGLSEVSGIEVQIGTAPIMIEELNDSP